jgi:hypothetical protein
MYCCPPNDQGDPGCDSGLVPMELTNFIDGRRASQKTIASQPKRITVGYGIIPLLIRAFGGKNTAKKASPAVK